MVWTLSSEKNPRTEAKLRFKSKITWATFHPWAIPNLDLSEIGDELLLVIERRNADGLGDGLRKTPYRSAVLPLLPFAHPVGTEEGPLMIYQETKEFDLKAGSLPIRCGNQPV